MYTYILIIVVFIFGRWIIDIFDSLFELFKLWITRIYKKIQIDINLMSKDYKDLCEEELVSTQAIGFHNDEPSQEECDCDEDECGCRQIGFRR